MVLCNNSIQETHYEILSVKQDASYEDIRASYRSAILDSHPDKSQSTSGSGDRFLKVQKAWEILGDSRSRTLYDSALRASSLDAMVAEDISLKDVMAEDAGEAIQLFYQCRCGDYFFVDSLELEKMGYGLKLSVSSRAEECLTSDFDEEQEVIVSAIRSRAMEKLRRKPRSFSDSFSFVYSSKSGDLFITQKGVEKQEDHEDDEKADFLSVASCLSCCSSDAASRDVFLSVKTSLSRCSSLNGIEFRDFPRQSIIQQFRHCDGWPFGLCRKAVLLPPLPKSPSESWLWKKGTKFVKMV
ncbi:hypothetical protein D8674_015244 [Pyrus ussuriensis x Pyrus communis]|uniref:J domain-containing protein n=1 Tax=Pyrus ussuriensis x Pyrus communis TaxID=2448454 RepID=A0A5N5GUT8_9ROSA|nr:hypothetical protein D8674_015244 [Pyrus ussuriensis x Pyrus communis]